MQKILITGGAGYIGSILCTELVRLGYSITVIDKLVYSKNSLNHLFSFNNFKFYKYDVTELNSLKKLIKTHDIIIPLAAYVGAPLCDKYRKEAKILNLENIKFIVSSLNDNHKIIYPTTNSGYGIGKKNKFCNENSDLNPISLYGQTKVDAEKIVLSFKNSISFRLATVFGYSYRMRTDLLVNNFVETAFNKRKLTIFEPHFRRNFIHVKDVASAFIFAIKNFNLMRSNSYNVGLSNANISKIILAKKIKKIIPGTLIKIVKNKKDPDQRDYYVSNKKIEKLGFRPTINLEDGIKEMINIMKINDKDKIINNY